MDAQQQLNKAIATALTTVPGCIAVGLVNLDIGALMSYQQTTNHPSAVLEMTAAATQNFLEGEDVRMIEKMIAESRGVPGESLIEGFAFWTRGTRHFAVRGGKSNRLVAVIVCRRDANPGMIEVKGKQVAETIFKAAE